MVVRFGSWDCCSKNCSACSSFALVPIHATHLGQQGRDWALSNLDKAPLPVPPSLRRCYIRGGVELVKGILRLFTKEDNIEV